jgi:hypothetical protein
MVYKAVGTVDALAIESVVELAVAVSAIGPGHYRPTMVGYNRKKGAHWD